MRTNLTPDQSYNWSLAKVRIAKELEGYYRACKAEELPQELISLSKKLDEELSTEHGFASAQGTHCAVEREQIGL